MVKKVNLPEELVSALAEKRLVIFAGAGVSKNAPSNYPDFRELASQIARQAGGVLTIEEREPVDRFLGRLKKEGTNVHGMVQQILTNPESKPNEMHYHLTSLFSSPKDVRIVTTNFDQHFSFAAAAVFRGNVQTYRAPALPLGRKFSGLVYLHGCVDQEAEELILTDSDFGKAYLTEGWATRFLQEMFGNYVVLFIGYSHNDPIMQYLGRGLPPDTPRYAFTPANSIENWRFLNIEPVTYPYLTYHHQEGSLEHSALVEAVKSWSERIKMGFLEHEQRIKDILKSAPDLLELDKAGYLEDIIRKPETARLFVKYARTPEWLRWAEEKGHFKALFKPDTVTDEISPIIAWWFAESYACQHDEEALALVERQGQRLNPVIWEIIFSNLTYTKELLEPKTLAKWVAVLLHSTPPPDKHSQAFDDLLSKCRYPEDICTALLLFEHLTKPYLILGPYFGFPTGDEEKTRQVDFKVIIRGEEYFLREAWEKFFKPNLEALENKIEPIITGNIKKANQLLRAVGSANEKYDPLSIMRSAIEPHGQDQYLQSFDVLIDAARDLIEYFLEFDPGRAQALIKEWASSGVPLLKRLAIHGVTESDRLPPEEKISWLLAKGWLYAYELKHEAFRLLKIAYPQASLDMRKRLFQKIEEGPEETKALSDQAERYKVYNLFYWLSSADPDCQLVASKFKEAQKRDPKFQPREYPDFDMWSSVETGVGPQSPFTVDELLAKSPPEIIDFLLTFQGEKFRGPDREGLLFTVKEAASKSFERSWLLVEELKKKGEWATELWESIFWGWRNASLNEDNWSKVLSLLKDHPELFYSCKVAIIDLLTEGARKITGGLPLSLLDKTENIVISLREIVLSEEIEEESESKDWLTKAIQHPGGNIAEFWLYALVKRREETEEKRAFLPDSYKGYFEKIICGPSYADQMGRIILITRLNFLFALDSEWTLKNIVPLLDWSLDRKRAQQTWHGYLWWGKWNEALLPGLMLLYEHAFAELAGDLSEKRDRFCEHLANIAVYGNINPVGDGWLYRFLMKVEEKDRVHWASRMLHQLGSLPEKAIKNIWDNWLREYWNQRNNGVPLKLSPDELRQMIAWITKLKPVFPSVVEQICAMPSPGCERTSLYFKLKELVHNYPQELIKLLAHLLSGEKHPFYFGQDVKNIVEELVGTGVHCNQLKPIYEQLARLGI